MMELIDQLKETSQTRNAEALKLYREIVFRNRTPQAGDVKKLRDAMLVLGLGDDQVKADVDAANRCVWLKSNLLEGKALKERLAEPQAAVDAAVGAMREFVAGLVAAMPAVGLSRLAHDAVRHGATASYPEIELKVNASVQAGIVVDNIVTRNNQFERDVAQLERDNPRIFGD